MNFVFFVLISPFLQHVFLPPKFEFNTSDIEFVRRIDLNHVQNSIDRIRRIASSQVFVYKYEQIAILQMKN